MCPAQPPRGAARRDSALPEPAEMGFELLQPASEKREEAILGQLAGEARGGRDLADLRAWQLAQPHLPQPPDDRLLQLFLRGCKQDAARARRKLQNFYRNRACPELFSRWDPADGPTRAAANIMRMAVLPRLTEDGQRVTVFRFRPHRDSDFVLRDMARLMLMMAEVRMSVETVLSGDIFVFDLRHITLAHWARLASPLLGRALRVARDNYPQRLRHLHFVHAPASVHVLISLFRGLMSEKLRDRFTVHGTVAGLAEHIPQSALPAEYGGTAESAEILAERWAAELLARRDSLQAACSRSGPPSQRDLHGCRGTFRALAVD